MSRFKKLAMLMSFAAVLGLVGLVIDSCENSSWNESESESNSNTEEYLRKLNADLSSFLNMPIVSISNHSRAFGEDGSRGPDSLQTVFIDFPELPKDDLDLDSVLTPQDMVDLMQTYGAEFSLEDDGAHDYAIQLSVAEVENVLTPLAHHSREFLAQRGLTNAEMETLLVELNLDESCFISLAMIVASDCLQCEAEIAWTQFGRIGLFSMPAYATSAKDVSWNCLRKALGVTSFERFFRDQLSNQITLELATRFLTSVAPKYLGWVGAAISLVEFLDCTVHYDRYF